MRLFVANATKQIVEFHYRLPEKQNLFYVQIQPGNQKPLAQNDLSNEDIDHIIKQHQGDNQEYFVDASKIDSTKGIKGLLYSIDKPVSADGIERCLEANDVEMTKQADEFRKMELAATSLGIESNEAIKSEGITAKIESVSAEQDGGEGVNTAAAFKQTVAIAK